jgi:hypothetical protein
VARVFRTTRGMTLSPSLVLRMASPPQEDIIPHEADGQLFNHRKVPVRQCFSDGVRVFSDQSQGKEQTEA